MAPREMGPMFQRPLTTHSRWIDDDVEWSGEPGRRVSTVERRGETRRHEAEGREESARDKASGGREPPDPASDLSRRCLSSSRHPTLERVGYFRPSLPGLPRPWMRVRVGTPGRVRMPVCGGKCRPEGLSVLPAGANGPGDTDQQRRRPNGPTVHLEARTTNDWRDGTERPALQASSRSMPAIPGPVALAG